MYENIGKKIKIVAVVIALIGTCVSFCYGLIMLFDSVRVAFAILTMLIGPFISWVSSFVLYGFGQLIENSDKLVDLRERRVIKDKSKTSNTKELIQKIKNTTPQQKETIKKSKPTWNDEIKKLSTEELKKRIEQKDDWQEEYIYLCGIELEKRNDDNSDIQGFV